MLLKVKIVEIYGSDFIIKFFIKFRRLENINWEIIIDIKFLWYECKIKMFMFKNISENW